MTLYSANQSNCSMLFHSVTSLMLAYHSITYSTELLWLDANNLHGTLPNEIASLTKLSELTRNVLAQSIGRPIVTSHDSNSLISLFGQLI
jgi:hypothetical protein